MAKFINARLRQPRDSEANWNSKNPTLLNGERVFVDIYDENNILIETKEKIGDGENHFLVHKLPPKKQIGCGTHSERRSRFSATRHCPIARRTAEKSCSVGLLTRALRDIRDHSAFPEKLQ